MICFDVAKTEICGSLKVRYDNSRGFVVPVDKFAFYISISWRGMASASSLCDPSLRTTERHKGVRYVLRVPGTCSDTYLVVRAIPSNRIVHRGTCPFMKNINIL